MSVPSLAADSVPAATEAVSVSVPDPDTGDPTITTLDAAFASTGTDCGSVSEGTAGEAATSWTAPFSVCEALAPVSPSTTSSASPAPV